MLLVGISLASTASAVVVDGRNSPYQTIMDRNAFRLSPAKPVVAEPVVKPISFPKITLTGITTILGRKMVFLTIAANKPGEMPRSLVFTEGQAAYEVEVKSIDVNGGVVSLVNHGESQTLDFDHNGEHASSPGHTPESIDRMPSQPTLPPPVRMEPPLSPEEQTALIEIQRIKYAQENNPVHQILPPTEMTPETQQN
jgi:hypothetical protein